MKTESIDVCAVSQPNHWRQFIHLLQIAGKGVVELSWVIPLAFRDIFLTKRLILYDFIRSQS